MNKRIPLLFAPLYPFLLSAQLIIQVASIPANTPAPDKIYIAGNFNNWNPADANYILQSSGGTGQYQLVLNPSPGMLEYKFTRGNWSTVEGNASGKYIPNRILRYDGKPQTIRLDIAGWQDRDAGGGGTAAPNVFELDDDFYIPQLGRKRRVWVYLPPDYATAKKRYPVLYMHDGQNLFDNESSSFGEWQLDEALNNLFNQGDYGCIVIGIDHGGAKRQDEYSPWKNPEYGGGEGAQYLDFVVKTLKPYVDSVYRTLPGCETTGIAGSSMGGLISMYAITERPEVFCRAGVFSPAFWFADHVRSHPKRQPGKVYFLAGGNEPDYVETDIIKVGNAMLSAGYMPQDINLTVPPDGQHSEWFWRREFPAAYRWMFAGAVSKPGKSRSVGFDLPVESDSSGAFVRIADIKPKERVQIKIVGANGQVWMQTKIRGDRLATTHLPKGGYVLLVKRKGKDWEMGALLKH
jgi:predicted alpha/beta superfamily hydrolase